MTEEYDAVGGAVDKCVRALAAAGCGAMVRRPMHARDRQRPAFGLFLRAGAGGAGGKGDMTKPEPPVLRYPEKAYRPAAPRLSKPDRIPVRARTGEGHRCTQAILREAGLTLVCDEVSGPNLSECCGRGQATFMVLGNTCTRGCAICNVATGWPEALNPFEPGRVAKAANGRGLRHVVAPSVDHGDPAEGAAAHFPQTIRANLHVPPKTKIEIRTADIRKCDPAVAVQVTKARLDVFSHNPETVPGFCPQVRPGARHSHSLRLLGRVRQRAPMIFPNSGLGAGRGEDRQSALLVTDDPRAAGVELRLRNPKFAQSLDKNGKRRNTIGACRA